MITKKQVNCALCGLETKLTFEHIPPKCAFNNDSIYIQTHEQMVKTESPLYGKKSLSHRGFGKFCLCASCNNATGNWYAKDFCDFIIQGQKILNESDPNGLITGEYNIKPLNVLKQILLMFVCADSAGILRKHKGVVKYLMNKKSIDFPEKISVYIYSNACSYKRMMGYSFGIDTRNGEKFQWSEINYEPFGYVLTYDSNPPNPFMVNISGFNETAYDVKYNILLKTVYLKVSNEVLGHYDNVPNDWINKY